MRVLHALPLLLYFTTVFFFSFVLFTIFIFRCYLFSKKSIIQKPICLVLDGIPKREYFQWSMHESIIELIVFLNIWYYFLFVYHIRFKDNIIRLYIYIIFRLTPIYTHPHPSTFICIHMHSYIPIPIYPSTSMYIHPCPCTFMYIHEHSSPIWSIPSPLSVQSVVGSSVWCFTTALRCLRGVGGCVRRRRRPRGAVSPHPSPPQRVGHSRRTPRSTRERCGRRWEEKYGSILLSFRLFIFFVFLLFAFFVFFYFR